MSVTELKFSTFSSEMGLTAKTWKHKKGTRNSLPCQVGLYILTVIVVAAFRHYDKTHEIAVSLETGDGYFRAQLWRLLSVTNWPDHVGL